MTLDELAETARVSRRTIYRLHDAGRGPTFTKIGRKTFVAEADALTWLTSMKQPGAMAQAAA